MTLQTRIVAANKLFFIRLLSISSVLFFLFSGLSFGQNTATISGTITDSTGKALEGANISLFGLPTGTTSSAEGKYSLQVPSGQIKIIFSYAGLKTDTVNAKMKAGEKRVLDRSLKSSVTQLPEFTVKETPVSRVNMTQVNPKMLFSASFSATFLVVFPIITPTSAS